MLWLLFLTLVPLARSSKDEIKSLPGLDFDINFKHYSGYLKVSKTHFLHYWFVESQNDPANDPLMFWFNGGPGCSSLEGLLHEMGPYQVNEDGATLRENPNSWNKFASVVYLESPVGVGYSYSTEEENYFDDDLTSLDNYKAIKLFFKKYPSFKNNPTFIFGESYGGVYVPTLTSRVIAGQANFSINLKGVGIGNGWVSREILTNTDPVFLNNHGFVEEELWSSAKTACCKGCSDDCDFSSSCQCSQLADEIKKVASDLNIYDIYAKCTPPSDSRVTRTSFLSPKDRQIFGKTAKSFEDIRCLNDTDIYTYMNSAQVRKALHIHEAAGEWNICNMHVHVPYIWSDDMSAHFKKIVKSGIRVLMYYGDTDLACSYLLGQRFSEQLGLKKLAPKTVWKVDDQVGGYKTEFEGLTFITIKGAGHMAPQWKPAENAYAVKQFVNDREI